MKPRSRLRLRLTAVVITLSSAAIIGVLVTCLPPRRVSEAPRTAPSPVPPSTPVPQTLPAQPARTRAPEAVRPLASHPRHQESEGRLAVIIDDAGYSLDELQPFLDLPDPLTIAVLPNLPHSAEAARRVLAAGKDLILHCPMEADGGQDPGPGAIRTGMTPEQINEALDRDFASVPGAEGMNNHMGSRATADPRVMMVVLDYLKRHGKFFIDSRTTPDTVGEKLALELGVPTLRRNLFLDDDRSEKEIGRAFRAGIMEAKARGYAVAIGHVQTRGVLDILRGDKESLSEQGVRQVRLQEIMKEQAVAYAP